MKNHVRYAGLVLFTLIIPAFSFSQDFVKNSEISGSTQVDAQYYVTDTAIGITDESLDGRLTRLNGYTEINYGYKNFTAGIRFEAYLPPLIGYDMQYEGAGVPYWYVRYKNDKMDITAGNFYEQFGNGMALRTWQEWTLGFDNSLRGLRVQFTPVDGVVLKGVWGFQRNYWEPYKDNNRGIVKGADAEFYLNDMFTGLKDARLKLNLGGNFVSDYQRGKSIDIPFGDEIYSFQLPENVATMSGRVNLNVGGWNFYSEYAHKINDPSSMNHFIYKDGNGLFSTLSYSQKGLGINLAYKVIDNMSYKSNRYVTNNQLDINYLPSITKQHAYALASMYPYATQTTGEYGYSGTLTYTIPKNTKVGGKYGTSFTLNFSRVTSISKDSISGETIGQPGTAGYTTNFFRPGDELYYQDFNIDMTRKFSKKWKIILTYLNQIYNKDIVEGHVDEYGLVYSNIAIADVTWNVTQKHSLRGEIQGLWTHQDKGEWLAGLLEYTISPMWFFSIQDQWNYGNDDPDLRLHYYLISAGFTYNTTRIAFSYGRQREGILCVGGVCRYVPAASGITFTVTSSF